MQCHASSLTQHVVRHHHFPSFLNCTFTGHKSRPPSAKFRGQVCSSQALSSGRNSASTGLSFPSTLRTHVSLVSSLLFSSSEQSPQIHASSITSVSSTDATSAVDGVDFLVFRICQALPAVFPLVTFLATMAALAFKLGWSVLVSRGTLCLSLAFAAWLGRPHTKHPFPLPLPLPTPSTSIGVTLALLGFDSTPRPSLSKIRASWRNSDMFCRTTRYFQPVRLPI